MLHATRPLLCPPGLFCPHAFSTWLRHYYVARCSLLPPACLRWPSCALPSRPQLTAGCNDRTPALKGTPSLPSCVCATSHPGAPQTSDLRGDRADHLGKGCKGRCTLQPVPSVVLHAGLARGLRGLPDNRWAGEPKCFQTSLSDLASSVVAMQVGVKQAG